MRNNLARSLGYLLIAMLSIQYGASVAKEFFLQAGNVGTSTFRTFFAALILLAVWRPWRKKLSGESWRALAGYGIALGLMNLLFYLAIARIPLGIAVTLEFTGPLAVALLASKKSLDLLWAFLAALGIWLILPGGHSPEALDIVGILLALGAGGCWALYIIFGQRAGKSVDSGAATTIGMCFASLAILPFGIYYNGPELVNVSLWPIGLVIAVLSSALPYNFEMMAMKNLPQKTFGILMSMEPVIATLMGFLFLKETLTGLQVFAMICVIIASAGSTATSRSPKTDLVGVPDPN